MVEINGQQKRQQKGTQTQRRELEKDRYPDINQNQSLEDIFDVAKSEPEIAPEKSSDQVEGKQEFGDKNKPETEQVPEPAERRFGLEAASRHEDESRRQSAPPPEPPVVKDSPAAPVKSRELLEIERILSENLDDLFLNMTPQQQMEFKIKGEEAASRIEQLLSQARVRVKEIFVLIRDWLKMIPGVNKFFLEQEAKIKTDRILRGSKYR